MYSVPAIILILFIHVIYIGIESSFVDMNNELVLITSTLPSATVTSLLKETGKLVVFRGYGGASDMGQY